MRNQFDENTVNDAQRGFLQLIDAQILKAQETLANRLAEEASLVI